MCVIDQKGLAIPVLCRVAPHCIFGVTGERPTGGNVLDLYVEVASSLYYSFLSRFDFTIVRL